MNEFQFTSISASRLGGLAPLRVLGWTSPLTSALAPLPDPGHCSDRVRYWRTIEKGVERRMPIAEPFRADLAQ